jgi:hypothetical protein
MLRRTEFIPASIQARRSSRDADLSELISATGRIGATLR